MQTNHIRNTRIKRLTLNLPTDNISKGIIKTGRIDMNKEKKLPEQINKPSFKGKNHRPFAKAPKKQDVIKSVDTLLGI